MAADTLTWNLALPDPESPVSLSSYCPRMAVTSGKASEVSPDCMETWVWAKEFKP